MKKIIFLLSFSIQLHAMILPDFMVDDCWTIAVKEIQREEKKAERKKIKEMEKLFAQLQIIAVDDHSYFSILPTDILPMTKAYFLEGKDSKK